MFWSYNLTLPTGVMITYWQLLSINVNVTQGVGHCQCAGYLSQAAQQAGSLPVLTRFYQISFASLDPTGAIASAVSTLVQAAQTAAPGGGS